MAMMEHNVFLGILDGSAEADVVYQDDHVVAFRDLAPQAPTHVLVIPRREIRTHADMTAAEIELFGRLHWAARQIAEQEGLTDYRLTMNSGAGAGQSVPHVHLHLLGGRPFDWPPG